eukprot:g919.t1
MYSILFALLVASSSAVLVNIPSLELPDIEFKSTSQSRHLLDDKEATQSRLWKALNNGDLKEMEAAIKAGANVNDKTEPSGYRPLHLAASAGNYAAVKLLIEHGAEVDAKTTNGTAPLHFTANHGDVLSTKALLDADAYANIRDHRKFAPLHYASYGAKAKKSNGRQFMTAGYFEMSREVDVEASEMSKAMSKQSSPGMGQFREVVAVLIEKNADVNAITNAKETPLHYTPGFDRYLIAQDLIKAGADVNKQDAQKETPLHEAVAYGAIGVTQVLLLNGANTKIEEEHQLTPSEFICRCRTYRNDKSLTQCAPGKCVEQYDTLVIEKIFEVAANRH